MVAPIAESGAACVDDGAVCLFWGSIEGGVCEGECVDGLEREFGTVLARLNCGSMGDSTPC